MRWAIAQKGYSQRRACGLISLAPKTYRYRSRRADDGELRRRLRQLAAERRRFGYRRLLILLRREGIGINHKRLFRLYREERLAVRSAAAASARSGRGRRSRSRRRRTSAGASTSPRTC